MAREISRGEQTPNWAMVGPEVGEVVKSRSAKLVCGRQWKRV